MVSPTVTESQLGAPVLKKQKTEKASVDKIDKLNLETQINNL